MENQFLLGFITPIALTAAAVIVYLIRNVNALKHTLSYQQRQFDEYASSMYRELQNIRDHAYTNKKEFMDEVRSRIESSNHDISNELHEMRRDNEGAIANTVHICESSVQKLRDEVEGNLTCIKESIEMRLDELHHDIEEINENIYLTIKNLSTSKDSEGKYTTNALLCD
jgi:gas vesicle protein